MIMFWEPVIIENDELKKLRLLVHRLRQEVVNCVCDIIHAQSQGKLNKKTERNLFDTLNEKRKDLDNVERALSVAETYNYELMEARQLAQSKQEDKETEKQMKKEELFQRNKENILAKKHHIQEWIENKGVRMNSDTELLKAILYELGTIRNWIIDPEEYEKIQKSE